MAGHAPRRSERSHKQSSEQPVSRGRSRSGSASRSTSQRRCARSIPNVDESSPRKRKRSPSFHIEEPKFFSRIINGRTVDRFCWLCHKECDSESVCAFCPRSYHEDCFRKNKGNCECHLKAVGVGNDYRNMGLDLLKHCLEIVMEQSMKEDKKNKQKSRAVNNVFYKNFQTWPPEKNKLLKIMDIDILIDNMNSEEPYKTTGEFFADVKWIYHNCYIIYGPNHPITEAAFKMEKNFKQELIDMEACPECYCFKLSYEKNFFTRPCSRPHLIVWAKLRGSPFWPAKCLKISNGHADVRFFGTHDKSIIPISKCYKISEDNPLKEVHQAKYLDAVNELLDYIKNYESSRGPFHYYPRKTSLEDCISSAKKFNKKGHHKQNNMEPANRNSGPKELKFRTVVQNFVSDNVTDPEEVDNDPNIVCHMDFIADEHNEPYCELNNSENIVRFSTSLPVSSLNPDLTSFEQAPRILSTGTLTNSNELELPPETQNSLNILVNSLPVITSVSTDEMALNELPVNTSAASNDITTNEVSTNSSTSSLLPLIASAVSASEIFAQENVNISVNDPEASSLNLCNNLMRNESFSGLLESDNEDDDEVQIVSEEGIISITDQLLNNPQLTKVVSGILISNRPHLKKLVLQLQSVVMRYIVTMMVESCFVKFDKNEVKKFIGHLKRFTAKINKLKIAIETANKEKEKEKLLRQEADNRRLLAEAQLVEALNAKAKLEEELKELKRRAVSGSGEIQNHKAELKECIIRKAAEKIQSNDSSYFLEQQLNEAKEKLNIKEANISLLNEKTSTLESDLECARESIHKVTEENERLKSENERLKSENERLKSDLSSVSGKSNINMCHFGVQTEETRTEFFRRNMQESDSMFDLNSTTDSSELNKDFLENQNETRSISDPSVTQLSMRQTSYIYETLESNSDFSSSVVQQVFEQNVAECTSVMTTAGAGLMSTAPPPGMMSTAPPPGMMRAAAPTLVQVPMVMPTNTFISSPGPYILDAQSSAVFLNSINPPDPPPLEPFLKSKSKSSSAMKYSVKRRKKHV